MLVKQRLKKFVDYLNISDRQFERNCGLNYTYINSIRKSIQPEKIQMIKSAYPSINISWLLTGQGNMIITDQVAVTEEPLAEYGNASGPVVRMLQKQLKEKENEIARLNRDIGKLKSQIEKE